MRSSVRLLLPVLALALAWPLAAAAITEPKTEVEYPDRVTVTCDGQEVELAATGVGLREKTFMKVDVYTIVSYVAADADLGPDKGAGLVTANAPKRVQMDLCRSFSREKLIGALVEVIDKNYEDQSAFAAELEMFKGYFTRDAQEGDVIVFDSCPVNGLAVILNDEVIGMIEKPAFTEALWSVWFGAKPAADGLKRDLLGALP
ncbi:MAG: chalcone isomerase family protein [Candidatus Krumholzibacteriia bacterium]